MFPIAFGFTVGIAVALALRWTGKTSEMGLVSFLVLHSAFAVPIITVAKLTGLI